MQPPQYIIIILTGSQRDHGYKFGKFFTSHMLETFFAPPAIPVSLFLCAARHVKSARREDLSVRLRNREGALSRRCRQR